MTYKYDSKMTDRQKRNRLMRYTTLGVLLGLDVWLTKGHPSELVTLPLVFVITLAAIYSFSMVIQLIPQIVTDIRTLLGRDPERSK